jgi:hypothetical protein
MGGGTKRQGESAGDQSLAHNAKYYRTPDNVDKARPRMASRLIDKGLAAMWRSKTALRRFLFRALASGKSPANCPASQETRMNTEIAILRDRDNDHDRENPTQLGIIRDLMLEAAGRGAWLTLREIAEPTAFGEASISAQLRHLRKARHGRYRVEKRQRRIGESESGHAIWLWEYQILPPNFFVPDEGGRDAEACH